MIATIVNCITIIAGSSLGLLLKKFISERISNTVMNGVAICVMYIGISGIFKSEDTLMIVVSVALGGFIGSFIDIDKYLNKLGFFLEKRVKVSDEKTSVAKGFVSASLLFCVGAMAIIGSFNSGLNGNHEILFTKSVIDGVSAIILASTLGIGVMFSAGIVFAVQGFFTLCAGFIAPYLSEIMINDITAVGSVMIVGLSLNMLKLTDIKIVNLLPAMFIPPIYTLIITSFTQLFS